MKVTLEGAGGKLELDGNFSADQVASIIRTIDGSTSTYTPISVEKKAEKPTPNKDKYAARNKAKKAYRRQNPLQPGAQVESAFSKAEYLKSEWFNTMKSMQVGDIARVQLTGKTYNQAMNLISYFRGKTGWDFKVRTVDPSEAVFVLRRFR